MNAHVAIAILNYNGRHYLERFLPFVVAATYSNKSIWVIDNASTDDSIPFLQANYPAVQVVVNSSNLGFAEGYNEGLSQIQADYFVLLNSDVEVTPGFIEPILQLMQADETIAFAQPKLLHLHQRDTFEYAGAAGGLIDAIGYPFCRGRVLETKEKDSGQYDAVAEVFWASGCCLFAKAEVYRQLGGMYNFLYMQNEDIDLCWRAQNEGYKVLACGQSAVYHQGGGSLSWENPQKVFFTFRNNWVMITRNMPVLRLFWVLPLRLLIDMTAALHYFLQNKPAAGKAVLKGIAAWGKWLFSKDVYKWPQKTGFAKCKGVVQKILVWQYFVRKKKTVADIVFHPNNAPLLNLL